MHIFQLTYRDLLSTKGGNICIHTIQPQLQGEARISGLSEWRIRIRRIKNKQENNQSFKVLSAPVEGAEML